MYCAYIPLSLLHGAKAGFTYTPFGLGIEQYLGVLPKAMWRALFFFFHLDDCRYHTRNAPLGVCTVPVVKCDVSAATVRHDERPKEISRGLLRRTKKKS